MNGDSTQEKSAQRTIFHELINNEQLPAEERSLPRLVDEGQTMIAAGQETTSFFLRTATYYILADPAILSKLKAELITAISDSTNMPHLSELQRLPYLHAVVQETHRFSHGVTGRLQRISPDKPIKYGDWLIPAGTPVSMTSLLQHKDPNKFRDPESFRPDRWLSGKTSEKYLVPFCKGSRQCLGLNLANAEIYLTLATVFRRFDMELYETTARDAEVAHDFFIPHGHADSKGVRVIFK
jgi:cytochrome P450